MMKGPSNFAAPHASKAAQQAVVMPPTTKSGTTSVEAIVRRIFMRAPNLIEPSNVMGREESQSIFSRPRGTIVQPATIQVFGALIQVCSMHD